MLVGPAELLRLIEERRCVVFDCRFDLQHTEAGRDSWLAGHVPGAVYAHLDDDLSAPVTPGSGRHPLPSPQAFAAFLARSGWTPGMLAVAYDGGGGPIASRLWWLMKYFGLDSCALLDGGMGAWLAQGLPIEAGETRPEPAPVLELEPRAECVLTAAEVAAGLEAKAFTLLDARPAARFAGEVEPLDSVAGHIPGAVSHPCDRNLELGRLRPPAELARDFRPYAGKDGSSRVAHMCGSGVTACLNLFAMEYAGFPDNQLYAGSWSEWIRDPDRPVARGED